MQQLLCFFLFVLPVSLFAQPADAKIKSDAVGNGGGVISFKFTKSTGTRQWNSSTGNWEYVRGVQVKRKSDYAGINMIVDEDVVYQYTGNGGYSFWKVRVLSNSYEGIPNPSATEINDFISRQWERFYGFYYGVIVKLHQPPVLAENPEWIWHDINSVEFKMKLQFDHIIRGKGIETVATTWKVRLYRDDPKAPWKNLLALRSNDPEDSKILGMKEYTVQQLADFEKQTLRFTMAEQVAKKDAERLTAMVTVPEFKNAEDMVKFIHDVLRNGSPEKLRAVLLQLFHPGFFEEGSKVQLQAVQEQSLQQVITAAYNNKATYKQMYCQNPPYRVDKWADGNRKTIYITGAVNNCNSSFTIGLVNVGYKEGVAQTALKILEYGVFVRQDADAINFINSFSDRKNLCKQD